MCGIAGIIQQSGSFDVHHIKLMMDSLSHRGPDGELHWQSEDKKILLGHRRLSIIDLSDKGCQPMTFNDKYVIIHNGEIYNYLELRQQLKSKGYVFTSATDTEVITAAYDLWKENCLQHFEGMFAFAIWDRSAQTLFAARDRFGEKPFYYCSHNGNFLFASEMKSLWAAGIPKLPNFKMHFNFLTIGYTDNPEQPGETFYENILRLPAASFMLVKNGDISIKKYWSIEPDAKTQKIDDATAKEKLSELLTASVEKRLRSDVPVGISLSGGLDSSTLAALIHHQSINNTAFSSRAFTVVFPGFEKNEESFSETVARNFSLKQHKVVVSSNDLVNDFDKLCQHQEEPFGSSSIFAQFKLYELAAKENTPVIMDGQGADETLGGYTKYYKWYWQELFNKRKLLRSKEISSARKLGVHEPFGVRNILAALFPDLANVILEKQYLLRAIQHEDLDRDFVKQQSGEAYYMTPPVFSLNGALHFNTFTHGLEELLRYADRNAMAWGREVRLPFLDHHLVSFLFSLPPSFKIRQGWTKWLLRETMKEKLPAEITWRKEKIGFEPPQKEWMKNPALVEMIQEAKRKLVSKNILRPEVLKKRIEPRTTHESANFDWRYLTMAPFI